MRCLRIGILVLAAGRRAGGPETYEVQLLRALARVDKSNEYIVYCTGDYAKEAIGLDQENISYRVLSPSIRAISLTASLPLLLLKDRVDVLHATYAPPPWNPKKLLFTMHGLVNFLHPESFDRAVLRRLNALMKIGLRSAKKIICVSEHVRSQVHELMDVPLERMMVAYHGVSHHFRPICRDKASEYLKTRFQINDPFILYVGKIQQVKNISRLIHAYGQFRDQSGSRLQLVIAGPTVCPESGIEQITELGLESCVRVIDYVAPSELPMLYSMARMFVFPSLFESFGLPVVEAMACGTPVVTSNSSCLPEIAGDAAILVDPTDATSIADGIGRVDASPSLQQSLRARGFRRAAAFTWDACARRTLDAYLQVVHS
jgi:glycosyltransferase involved in cell wall biosynthesis